MIIWRTGLLKSGLKMESRRPGEVLEEVLTEELAFVEMSGTVQTHNYHQTNIELCHNKSLQKPEAVPPIQPNVMVPPDRKK